MTSFWVHDAGFVDDTGELFDDGLAIELGGLFDTDEREAGATEEFLHVFGVATDVVFRLGTIVELNGTDGTEGALVAEDEVNSLVFDKTVGFVAILAADFVAQESREADVGDDVKALTKNLVEELETVFLTASHELFARAIMETVNSLATATTGGYHDKN